MGSAPALPGRGGPARTVPPPLTMNSSSRHQRPAGGTAISEQRHVTQCYGASHTPDPSAAQPATRPARRDSAPETARAGSGSSVAAAPPAGRHQENGGGGPSGHVVLGRRCLPLATPLAPNSRGQSDWQWAVSLLQLVVTGPPPALSRRDKDSKGRTERGNYRPTALSQRERCSCFLVLRTEGQGFLEER